jgi:NAD(P)-dependent dehydrogenase (short-subunit alcohol dehydrogenase family)
MARYLQEDVRQPSAELEACAYRADVLVNNAAVYLDDPRRGAPALLDLDEDILRTSMEVNFIGGARLAQTAARGMMDRGFGRVVNISSGMARLGEFDEEAFAYRASKLGLNAFTIALARVMERSGQDLCSFAYCPGWLPTDMGGPDAPGSLAASADALASLIARGSKETNGRFFRLDRTLDWTAREPRP